MRHLPLIARLLLGLMFFVFGGIGLLNLFPPPPNLPEKLQAFTNGLMATGYFMPFLKGTETLCGLLLLSGCFVPLALVVLAPITINILLVHIFLEPSGLAVALVIAVLQVYLAFFASPYKEVIRQLFRPKAA
jgi:putative oxidoreductase